MNTHGKVWALIPIKEFSQAKSRLRPVLQAGECSALALNMARDVTQAIAACDAVHGTTLMGDGAEIENLARQLGCEFLQEMDGADLSANLDIAARRLSAGGVDTLLIMPGDLPTIQARDIADLLAGAGPGLTVCPAGRDGGTNALVIAPPEAISFQFGTQSARHHIEAGRAAGLPSVECKHAAFDVDIDTPNDLTWLCGQNMSGETGDYLDRTEICARLLNSQETVSA